jgi:hypothetical protein
VAFLQEQERKLAELKRQRAELAREAGEQGVVEALHALERRVALIEEKLSGGGAEAAGALDSAAFLSHTIGGTLKDGFMSDLLQLISSNEWCGVLVVGQKSDEIRVEFYEGQIWNASAPGAKGESAVFALMTRADCPYYFEENLDQPKQRTIESNTQFLILEGLRRIDEGEAGAAD